VAKKQFAAVTHSLKEDSKFSESQTWHLIGRIASIPWLLIILLANIDAVNFDSMSTSSGKYILLTTSMKVLQMHGYLAWFTPAWLKDVYLQQYHFGQLVKMQQYLRACFSPHFLGTCVLTTISCYLLRSS